MSFCWVLLYTPLPLCIVRLRIDYQQTRNLDKRKEGQQQERVWCTSIYVEQDSQHEFF